MITRGRIDAPFTHIVATSLTSHQLDGDDERSKKAELRHDGIFCIKIFDNIPLVENITNYIAVKSVQLDWGVLNSGKCTFYRNNAVIDSNRDSPIVHCHSLAAYLANLFPTLPSSEWPLIEEREKQVCVHLAQGEKLVVDEKTARTLALPDILLEGPTSFLCPHPVDLYSSCGPLIMIMPTIEESFVGNRIMPFLCSLMVNSQSIARVLQHEEGELHWKKLVAPIRDYIYLRFVDCLGNSIPFAANSEITVHLIIRSSPYDIV